MKRARFDHYKVKAIIRSIALATVVFLLTIFLAPMFLWVAKKVWIVVRQFVLGLVSFLP